MTFKEYLTIEHVIIASVIVLLVIFLSDVLDLSSFLTGNKNTQSCYYSYSPIGGPHTWKETFPDAIGGKQSPINIGESYAMVICSETIPQLNFSPEYNDIPKEMLLANDGHSVTLTACWGEGVFPTICGGPLPHSYRFLNIRMRWGPNDDEGSEHTIDCRRFGLEMQATYLRADTTFSSLREALDKNALLTISYLFQAVHGDNLYLKTLTKSLKCISKPYTSVRMCPIPLGLLLPQFTSKYYLYRGSLTTPPCTEGILWMVLSEPLGISSKQISKFRKLCSLEGPIDSNTRPVQALNNREVYYYD